MHERALIDRCPLCDEPQRSPWLDGLGFELVHCGGCGHRYATSVYARSLFAHAERAAIEPNAAVQRERFVEYRRLLGRRLRPGSRVLEIGCGAGGLLALFQKAGHQTFGIETDAVAALDAGARLGASIWCGPVESVLPASERFDLIVLTHVLEHSHEPRPLVRRLRGALREGGQLLIDVPNADDRLLRLWGGMYRPLGAGEHVSFFDAAHLQQLLRAQGLLIDGMAAPTYARDLVYASALSAADVARTMVGRSRPEVSQRRAGRLRRALDACLGAVDVAVPRSALRSSSVPPLRAAKTAPAKLRGPALIAVARAAVTLV